MTVQNAKTNDHTAKAGSIATVVPSGRCSVSTWLSALASVLSSALAIFCPACIPVLGALFASLGLGFAVSTVFLQPALIVLLLINLTAFVGSATRHHNWWVLVTGIVGGALVYGGRYVWFSGPLMWAGAAILIGTAFVNFRLKQRCSRCRII